jgi:AcrR family transcriptional regulator
LYFKNKEDAFAKVMVQVTEEMFREATAPWSGDPRLSLAQATRGFLDVFLAHRGLWRCLLEGMHQSKAIEDMWLELRRPFIDRIAHNLDRSVRAGLARPMNTRLAAHALGSMAEWAAYTDIELEAGPEGSTADDLAEVLTDLWFHAVYTRAPDDPN